MFTGSGNVPYGLHDKLTEGIGGIEQRHDQQRSNDVLRDGAVELSRIGALARIRSHGYLLDTLDIAKLNAQRESSRTSGARASTTSRTAARGRSWPRDLSGDRIRTRGTSSAAWRISRRRRKRTSRTSSACTTRQTTRILVVVGDFDPAQAKAWVAKYFGDIPRGKPITRPKVAPGHAREQKRGWCTRTACRSRASTFSGRPSVRRATIVSRSTCSQRSSPDRARRA